MPTEQKTFAQAYKDYSDEDKAVLKELKQYAAEKSGEKVTLKDILGSVEPGMETPNFLRKI